MMAPATTPASSNAVRVQAQLRFGSAFALDVDVQLPGRGVSAIFGPSGCGKTTLLRVVAGLARPDRGRVVVNGDVWQDDASGSWRPTHRRPLGMVFQEASLFPHLSVQGNLDFGLKRVPASQRRVPLAQAVELLGIGHLLGRKPAYLSGGERQRVAIARALATSPRLLLMDEPLASLDAPRKAELLPWLERLVHELSIPVLYVTHAVDEVTRLADHLLLLQAGSVKAAGAAVDLLSRLDVASAQGDQASVIVAGEVTAFHASDQLLDLRFSGGLLHCAHAPGSPARRAGQRLRARVMARDVSIALSRASDTSILNVLPATITELRASADAQVLVQLDAGGTRLLARITQHSCRALALAAGQSVYAQVKGVALLD